MSTQSSIYDVARLAGVSPGTVSRVFNNHANVAEATRHKVLRHARELSFTPKNRLSSIALVVADLDMLSVGGHISAMVTVFAKQLAKQELLMELVPIENLELLWQARVAGAVGLMFDDRFASLCDIPNLQLVSINLPLMEQGIPCVSVNHYRQGVLTVEHLLSQGHRQIAFFENSTANWGSTERRRGVEDALSAAGLALDPMMCFYAKEVAAYEAISRALNRCATAILNFSDPWIMEATHVLQNILHLRIPQDVSVICGSDSPLLRFMTPPHTVIEQPLEELGKTAIEMLVALMSASGSKAPLPVKPEHIQLEPRLVARDSVAVNAKVQ